jgi:hypothetical protein
MRKAVILPLAAIITLGMGTLAIADNTSANSRTADRSCAIHTSNATTRPAVRFLRNHGSRTGRLTIDNSGGYRAVQTPVYACPIYRGNIQVADPIWDMRMPPIRLLNTQALRQSHEQRRVM